MSIRVDLSIGELVDKITILEIKSERISEAEKLVNVRHELEVLCGVFAGSVATDISAERNQLKSINEQLWDIEDAIRDKERLQQFDQEFIELARSVYFTNDKRAAVKKDINLKTGSELVEEKSYQDYQS